MGADDLAPVALVVLGDLYQRAAQELGIKELRSFLVHQGEWLIHLGRPNSEALQSYVTQTQEYLERVLALTHPPPRRRGRRAVVRVVADP